MSNKYKDFLLSAANFLVIVLLFVFIVFGLNRIGILQLPGFVENIFFNAEDRVNILPDDDGELYTSLAKGQSTEFIQVVSDITPENVRSLLENVSVSQNYYHEVTKILYDGSKSFSQSAIVRCTDGLCEVSLFDNRNVIEKRIQETDDSVIITYHNSDNSEKSVTLPKGNISVEEESGVLITHKAFLEGDFVPPESNYSVAYSDYGTIMQITFDTNNAKNIQTNKYWLSLDYGVVVRAECYENNSLIYLLETKTISTNVG